MRAKRKSAVLSFLSFLWIAFIVPIILWALIVGGRAYLDRQSCVCSVLSHESQTLAIDARLERVQPLENFNSGTFAIITMQCDHGYRLWLKIDKDAGTYQGRIMD